MSIALLILGVALNSGSCFAQDYSFDMEEFEKKDFEWGGFGELKLEHINVNETGAFSILKFYEDPQPRLDRFSASIQFDGSYSKGPVDFKWLLHGSAQKDQITSTEDFSVFSAYASIKPSGISSIDLGKKTFKWGKGYAWNPVAFIDRPKDLNNPEESMEGYLTAGLDVIKSFSGSLQALALTAVYLPVREDLNDDFSEGEHDNIATKLYLLYRNTDIDLIWFAGRGDSDRYGLDFSRNLATNFEIHGEVAHIPSQPFALINENGTFETMERSSTNWLFGLRYLTKTDITTILEFYHHDNGYVATEMEYFYNLVHDANQHYTNTGDDTRLKEAMRISQYGYGSPQPGRNYLYAKVTKKEPFDLLYVTPGCTMLINLDDQSYSLSPEVVYSGKTNLEVRLRGSLIVGDTLTEHGEKLSDNKLEFRVRYFF